MAFTIGLNEARIEKHMGSHHASSLRKTMLALEAVAVVSLILVGCVAMQGGPVGISSIGGLAMVSVGGAYGAILIGYGIYKHKEVKTYLRLDDQTHDFS